MSETDTQITSLAHNDFNLGDSVTYRVEIDLPAVPTADQGNLAIEMFVLDINNGLAGFHICDTQIVSTGGQVAFSPTQPKVIESRKTDHDSIVS